MDNCQRLFLTIYVKVDALHSFSQSKKKKKNGCEDFQQKQTDVPGDERMRCNGFKIPQRTCKLFLLSRRWGFFFVSGRKGKRSEIFTYLNSFKASHPIIVSAALFRKK